MTLIPIDSIWVDRSERQRRELKPEDIQKLASSIQRTGRILHPPVIERSGKLRVGETRWMAARLLGWTHIEVNYIEDLEELELQLIELEENVSRTNLPWQDEALAILNYHELQVARDKSWTHAKTAEALGRAGSSVSQMIGVALELRGGNDMVKSADKFSTARGIVTRKNERKATSALASVVKTIDPTAKLVVAEKAREEKIVPLLNADFTKWWPTYTGPKFNFIHCDFPYGINAGEHDQGQAKSHGGYDDGFEVYANLLDNLGNAMSSIVADSAHLMFWFSMDYYEYTRNRLTEMGWRVNPFPLIWHKNDGTGILPDPSRGPRRIYETAFMASLGDRKIVRAKSNAVAWPGKDKEIHMSEKPVGMLRTFFEMFVDDTTIALDPTCGSGNSMKAAQALNAHSVLGLEINTEFFERAKEAYYD